MKVAEGAVAWQVQHEAKTEYERAETTAMWQKPLRGKRIQVE